MALLPQEAFDFVFRSSVAIDKMMSEFEKVVKSDKSRCVAFGAALIEAVKSHKWSWEEGEE